MLLMQIIPSQNRIINILLSTLISYILLGLIASTIYIITLSFKERVMLHDQTTFTQRIIFFFTILISWPSAVPYLFDLFIAGLYYMGCYLNGYGFRRNIMNDSIVVQTRTQYKDDEGNITYKELITSEVVASEEKVALKKKDSNETVPANNVSISGLFDNAEVDEAIPSTVSLCNVTTLELMKWFNKYGLQCMENVSANEAKHLDLGEKSFDLIFQEDVSVFTFNEPKILYVVSKQFKYDQEAKLEIDDSKLINEVHIDSDNNFFMIDHTNHEAYALDAENNEIMNCEYDGDDPEGQFTKVKIGDLVLKYKYDKYGVLEDISSNEKDAYSNFLRIVEVENADNKHITVTYPVPFLRTISNVLINSKDLRIYRTDDVYIFNDIPQQYITEYRVFNDKNEAELRKAFSMTVNNIQGGGDIGSQDF